ncbi:MAG: type 1 glutamine amidotransferase domain-containing protein [Planctomycetota bacterium]
MELEGKRIGIFVGDDYEDLELQVPKYRLLEAGAQVLVAGLKRGVVHHGKHGYPETAEHDVEDLDPATLDGVVVPGGWMPDKLRRYESVLSIVRAMEESGKLIASICHGPWIDISAGVVRGYRYTSTPGIRDDLVNAGAEWIDAPLVVDRHHVSSRRPGDLPDFCRAIVDTLRSS